MTVDPKDNAFPIINAEGEVYVCQGGLTKREYFAALAMQGLRAGTDLNAALTAHEAVKQSDALIAALNVEGQANG